MLSIGIDDARPSHGSRVYVPSQHHQALTVRGDLSRAHEAPMYLTAADGSIQEANPVLSGYSGRARRRAVVPLGYGRVLTTRTAGPGPRERSVELTGVVRDAREILIGSDPIRGGRVTVGMVFFVFARTCGFLHSTART